MTRAALSKQELALIPVDTLLHRSAGGAALAAVADSPITNAASVNRFIVFPS